MQDCEIVRMEDEYDGTRSRDSFSAFCLHSVVWTSLPFFGWPMNRVGRMKVSFSSVLGEPNHLLMLSYSDALMLCYCDLVIDVHFRCNPAANCCACIITII